MKAVSGSAGPICRSEGRRHPEAVTASGPMVDRLRKSLEELEPPVCDRCDLEMKWYRSEIQRAAARLVDHHFFCTSCGNISVLATTLNTQSPDDPGHLSLPFAALAACEPEILALERI
jgi:hypothetical protein